MANCEKCHDTGVVSGRADFIGDDVTSPSYVGTCYYCDCEAAKKRINKAHGGGEPMEAEPKGTNKRTANPTDSLPLSDEEWEAELDKLVTLARKYSPTWWVKGEGPVPRLRADREALKPNGTAMLNLLDENERLRALLYPVKYALEELTADRVPLMYLTPGMVKLLRDIRKELGEE